MTTTPNIYPSYLTHETYVNSKSRHDLLMEVVSDHFQLNEKQRIAYLILSKNMLQRCKITQDARVEMRMFLTGPGGTGKTHAILALQSLLAAYSCLHCIHFLAPTGSAASLVDGITIQSGLGIKISSQKKGKGG